MSGLELGGNSTEHHRTIVGLIESGSLDWRALEELVAGQRRAEQLTPTLVVLTRRAEPPLRGAVLEAPGRLSSGL